MKSFALILALLCSGFVLRSNAATQTCIQSTTSTLTCVASLTVNAGEGGALYIASQGTTNTFSPSDTCPQTWTHQTGASFVQGTSEQIDAWSFIAGVAGTCSITVTRSSGGSIRWMWVAATVTGVSSIGTFAHGGNTSAGTCSVSLATQDPNNVVIAGLAINQAAETFTATSGTVLTFGATAGSGSTSMAIMTNTSVTPATVTNAASLSVNGLCAKGAIEFRTTGTSGRAALASDSGGTIAMVCAVDCNYTLPGTPPSNRWNTIVTSQGTHLYKIVVNSPATINGSGNAITLPQFQSIRISTTADGLNYRAEFLPPTAGLGICITPLSNGIVVAKCSGDANHSKSLTGQTAAITTASLCPSTFCGAGQFKVTVYLASTVVCATPGPAVVGLTIGWTDEVGAKTQALPLWINGSTTPSPTLALGTTTGFAYGMISLWSSGTANITYSTSYTACTTGTGTYSLRAATDQMQ